MILLDELILTTLTLTNNEIVTLGTEFLQTQKSQLQNRPIKGTSFKILYTSARKGYRLND